MKRELSEKKENYKFITVQGSHYEIGFQLGEKLRNHSKSYPNIVTDSFKSEKTGFQDLKEAHDLIESFCPGITDEIQGLADGFNVPPERIAFGKYMVPFQGVNYCSQFIVLPSITEDGSIYIGRSYDYHPDDEDKILLRTKIKGKHSHIGFSLQAIGRGEGLNSKGLVVSFTGGGAFEMPITNKIGFNKCIAIRTLLDNCMRVDQAVELLLEMPVYDSTIFLIADKSGKAAVVEAIDSKYAVTMIDPSSHKQYLISTNHYNHPEMVSYNKYVNVWLMPNSQTRYRTITSKIESAIPNITKDNILQLLSQEMTEGVCSLYYEEWFGTLWSLVFDLTRTSVDVCFGPPTHNTYLKFTMDKPSNDIDYTSTFMNKFSSENV